MSNETTRDAEYFRWIKGLSSRYRRCQIKAAISVNREMLGFYWSLGRDICTLHAKSQWGSGFYKSLSRDLQREIPNAKGFSQWNLLYMKQFYEMFPEQVAFAPQLDAQMDGNSTGVYTHQPDAQSNHGQSASSNLSLARELATMPWGHIKLLCDKCKNDRSKAEFYIHETVQNGWSRALLLNHMDSGLYERQGKALSNFASTLPDSQSALVQEVTRDPYQFDFLAIRKDYDEKELKDALVNNISSFLLELGTGFAFVGREYRLKVGETEQWVDLLFYHYGLRCFVVVEVKITDFEASFIGQLGTYVSAVNHILRSESDQPTIGLLICKTKDNVLAQYVLEGSSQPLGISEYELSETLPESFRSSLPTIEEIESSLQQDAGE